MADNQSIISQRIRKECSVEGCSIKHHAKGLCDPHYRQMIRHGKIFNSSRMGKRSTNIFLEEGDRTTIILDDKYGNPIAKAVIDTEDAQRCFQYKWCLLNSGYAWTSHVRSNCHPVKLHNFILGFEGNLKVSVDHINRNGLDNRKENLRIAQQFQNKTNGKHQINNTTGYRGVVSRDGKYEARVTFKGIRHYLGRFYSKEEAAKAYNKKALELHGEFASLNDVPRSVCPEGSSCQDRQVFLVL